MAQCLREERGMLVVLSCSALGVVLRLLLYEHSWSIAYPAAKVQAGDPQGNQTMPCLQTDKDRVEGKSQRHN